MSEKPVAEATTPETGAPEPEVEAGEQPGTEETPKSYDEEYVRGLRDENAKHRREKTAALEALLMSRVDKVASDLADPSDLFVYVDRATLLGEDGLPDDALIAEAVGKLLEAKPYLQTREARGDIDQGARGVQEETFSFNEWLRSGAS